MKYMYFWFVSLVFLVHTIDKVGNIEDYVNIIEQANQSNQEVFKKVLHNGMTILVRPVHTVPKVSLQIWYHVGSKDEKTREKGIAHLIEHMIFKGTKKLSESDINMLVHKLSGSTNAFTSYDYTGYLFDLPSHNWRQILPVIADTMTDASFKDEHLNSEMKAVIQELKMYKDSYVQQLLEDMLAAIFPDHPYHYPIIGYKQDLWSVTGEDLRAFYAKHYIPNNAVLVVVGDVNPEEVFKLSEQYFGHLKPQFEYTHQHFYHNKDLASKQVVLYRDVKQPVMALAYVVPGMSSGNDYLLDVVSRVLGKGKASRLYNKIVDELKLATSLEVDYYSLFDHSIVFIIFEPKHLEDVEAIVHLIEDEISLLVTDGVPEAELKRAKNQARMKFYRLLENTQKQAYELGKFYLATGNEQYIYNYLNQPLPVLEKEVKELLSKYFRPAITHVGKILPLAESEKEHWKMLQDESDAEDNRILSARIRTGVIEPPIYAHTITAGTRNSFEFAKSERFTLSNGLEVLFYHTDNTPKIDLVLELKAKSYYEPRELQGIYTFISELMTEGTERYSAHQLAQELESRGIQLVVYPGGVSMSMPKAQLKKGLELLNEVVQKSTFDEEEITKVREQLLTRLKNFWDEPKYFISHLIKEKLYNDHPYSKNKLGTQETVQQITQNDLKQYYRAYITPKGARLAIVGDIKEYDLKAILQEELGDWSGPIIEDMVYPRLNSTQQEELNYSINRDQVVLALARLSVNRKHPDFDKLSIFDQIFGFGALGSMASRLFQLREQSGLFYTINGSLVDNASEESGIFLVKTIVSKDRLEEAEKAISDMLYTVVDSVTEQEFEEAKEAILNALVNNFESNQNIAQAFLFLDRYNFSPDYFDKRAEVLSAITLDQMKEAVHKVLQPNKMVTIRVGRV